MLQGQIIEVFKKGAINEVGKGDQQAGFFSHYFLIPNLDGELHPILYLRGLNNYLQPLKCKILAVPRV